jgi:hypothetical protein
MSIPLTLAQLKSLRTVPEIFVNLFTVDIDKTFLK